MMKGFELLARTIKDAGIDHVFGNPGSTELPMLRGIDNYILTLHDSISVGMADGYSQATGRPSMVNLHTLPGVANSMSFIHTARLNRTPLLITSGQQDRRHSFYEPILWHDLKSLVGNSVKYFYEVQGPADIERSVKRAISISMDPPRGPVFISFPMDVMDMDSDYVGLPISDPNLDLLDLNSVKRVADLLENASNPAIIAGFEVDLYGGHKELELLADKLGIPVFNEPLIHRAGYDSSGSNSGGDLQPASTAINLALLNNDFILSIGGDLTLYPYLPSPLLPGKKIITVSMEPSYRHGEYVKSNPRLFMKELISQVRKKGNYHSAPDPSLAGTIARERRNMGVTYVLQRAKKEFGNHVIVDEAISSSLLLRKNIGYKPNSYFSAKSGQLGWGLPAAAGISMKNKKVLEIVGDGSIMYTIQTLWTISKYSLPVKILVLDNGGYGILKSYSKSFYPGLENAPYLTFNSDILKIADAFGIESREADPEIKEMNWLAEGDKPRMLVAHVPKTVQKLFP